MELTIKGEAKEIAALVLELQGRLFEDLPNYIPADSSMDFTARKQSRTIIRTVSPDIGCTLESGLENQAEMYEDASSTASSLSVFINSPPFSRILPRRGSRGQERG